MWFSKKTHQIPWTARKTNIGVFKDVSEKKNKKSQTKFLGHAMRIQKLEKMVITGKLIGK